MDSVHSLYILGNLISLLSLWAFSPWLSLCGWQMQINKGQDTEGVESHAAAPMETEQKIRKPGIEINTL